MAAVAKKRSSADGGGHNTLSLPLCVVMVVVVAVLVMSCGEGVLGTSVSTNVTMVVSKTLLVGPCVDDSGAEVGDLAEWTTGCNTVVCHVEPSGNYTVTHGCRTLVESENPDSDNCVTVSNSGATYPSCCPYLQCGSASPLTTVSPSVCADLSSNSTCQIWKELSANCTDTADPVYNLTLVYCQQTCGFCSGGTG